MPDKIPFSEFTFKGSTYVLKDAVARAAIENLNSFEYVVCTSANDTPQDVIWNNIVGTLVPSEDTKYKIYLVPSSNGANDLYDEYITVQNGANLTWEKFGNTDINLSSYATKDNPTFTGSLSLGRKANTATGPNSVAIGMNTTATGVNSYATGNNVIASGNQAFAEGTSTIAAGTNQHAQGKYNITDTNNIYAEIVGNGTNDANRSNAYALDWNGNARFAGDVYVGCNDNSTGGTKLATIDDIPDIPVQDVQVNGVSVLNQNGTANVPKASSSQLGVVGIEPQSGVDITSNGKLELNPASTDDIKRGENTNKPIVPFKQDVATFYGLAKAAGDDTQSASSNAVGTYTDAAKSAIREMLDVPSKNIVMVQDSRPDDMNNVLWIRDTAPASIQVPTVSEMESYVNAAVANVNSMNIHICTSSEYNAQTGIPTVQNPDVTTFYLVPGGQSPNLYIEWVYTNNAWEQFGSATIDLSDYLTDVQINGASVVTNGVANIPKATDSTLGVMTVGQGLFASSTGSVMINKAPLSHIKQGTETYNTIVPSNQHESTFYGLAKAAGADMASSNNSVGTYTDAAKTAIQNMLGVQPGTEVVRLI